MSDDDRPLRLPPSPAEVDALEDQIARLKAELAEARATLNACNERRAPGRNKRNLAYRAGLIAGQEDGYKRGMKVGVLRAYRSSLVIIPIVMITAGIFLAWLVGLLR